ncbi:MAG: hypothetical protein Q9M16_04065 [Mariprofundus sp.]|nr:hypothetical protein [Mariprofundus sp.]
MLILSFLAVGIAFSTAQARSINSTMQVSMNVIPDCSVAVDYKQERNRQEQYNIRCSGESPHRIYYHRRSKHEEHNGYAHSDSQRSYDPHQKREQDHDEVVWLTTEF